MSKNFITYIFRQWCGAEMSIHIVCTLEQLFKVLKANGQANR